MHRPQVVITGAARRIGAAIARTLHSQGWRVALHYRGSRQHADALAAELNQQRADSACCLQADLLDTAALPGLVAAAAARWGTSRYAFEAASFTRSIAFTSSRST